MNFNITFYVPSNSKPIPPLQVSELGNSNFFTLLIPIVTTTLAGLTLLEALNWVEKTDHGPLEPLAAAQSHYSDSMQDSAAGTVWLSSGCKSWYLDPRSRKLTLIWPSFAHNFRHRNGHFSPDDYLDKEKA